MGSSGDPQLVHSLDGNKLFLFNAYIAILRNISLSYARLCHLFIASIKFVRVFF